MLTLLPIGLTTATADDDRNPQLFNARPRFHILPPIPSIYSHYQAKWWQWAASMPSDHHPLTDTADCSTGQSGPVWFIGGEFGQGDGVASRTCTVPAGKALFFPVLNVVYDFTSPDDTEAGARAVLDTIFHYVVRMSAEIDGHAVPHLDRYLNQSALFNIGPIPANPIFPELTPGGIYPSVDEGIYLLLLPLAPGEHTIHFSGEISVPMEVLGFPFAFTEDITYHLTVEPRRR